jgi:hypothetical protein
MPLAVELGDEYDDHDDEWDHGRLDSMVTDAMSSHAMAPPPPPTASAYNALDRLGTRRSSTTTNDRDDDRLPRAAATTTTTTTLKFHLKTYGCQMNVNDTDIVRSILLDHHRPAAGGADPGRRSPSSSSSSSTLKFVETNDEIDADVLLTNTCAIRENAEQKGWHRLRELRSHDRNFPLPRRRRGGGKLR